MPTVVDSWSGAVPSNRNKLMAKVARLYGYDLGDPEMAQLVLEFLDETVNDLNTGLFEFNKVVEQGIVLIDGSPLVDLSAPFYRESLAYLVSVDGSVNQSPLVYYPWVQFQRWFGDKSEDGRPQHYSSFNSERDRTISLHPTPNATIAAQYTLSIEYYKRVPLVSSVALNGSIEVPREIENVLIYGAQKRFAIHAQGPGHPDVAALETLEAKALDRLRRVDKLHPDERKQWILSDFAGRGQGRGSNTDFFVKY